MYIVAWYTENKEGGFMNEDGSINGDSYEVFDTYQLALKRYEELRPNVHSISIAGVLKSTDYSNYLGMEEY